jgi:hypothetical protein
MKLKISSLFLSLCLAILPSTLRADNKTVTEADATAPISINKGDTITFSLKETTWNFTPLASTFSDATVPTNDPKAALLSWSSTDTHNTAAGASISIVFDAANSGQMVVLFTKAGSDPVFKFTSAITFIVNINDPAAAK